MMDLSQQYLNNRSRCIKAQIVLGKWMSAALEDPKVCEEMKADITEWFAATDAFLDWVRYV